jgi:hypothetical protein
MYTNTDNSCTMTLTNFKKVVEAITSTIVHMHQESQILAQEVAPLQSGCQEIAEEMVAEIRILRKKESLYHIFFLIGRLTTPKKQSWVRSSG